MLSSYPTVDARSRIVHLKLAVMVVVYALALDAWVPVEISAIARNVWQWEKEFSKEIN